MQTNKNDPDFKDNIFLQNIFAFFLDSSMFLISVGLKIKAESIRSILDDVSP